MPKTSRMGEIGCRGRRSEATARSVTLGSELGSVMGCVVGSPRLGKGNKGGSNGIVPVGGPRIWLEPRCLGQSFDVSGVGLHRVPAC